jgi:CRISPR-associated protein Cas1
VQQLETLIASAAEVSSNQALMGVEGAGAASYFSVLGDCLVNFGV